MSNFGSGSTRKAKQQNNNGKGDWVRPYDKKKYGENYDKIFGKKEEKDEEKKEKISK